jgi:hypothetical protein
VVERTTALGANRSFGASSAQLPLTTHGRRKRLAGIVSAFKNRLIGRGPAVMAHPGRNATYFLAQLWMRIGHSSVIAEFIAIYEYAS